MGELKILHIAVPVPLRRLFDYLPPTTNTAGYVIQPGVRVRISFAHHVLVGLVVSIDSKTDLKPAKLKTVLEVIDQEPLFEQSHLDWLLWVSRYYHYPVGEAIFTMLPTQFRKPVLAEVKQIPIIRLVENKMLGDLAELQRAPKQQQIVEYFKRKKELTMTEFNQVFQNSHQALNTLINKGWLEKSFTGRIREDTHSVIPAPRLNADQFNAVNGVSRSLDEYSCYLINGVTGSGKTEVYLAVIESVLKKGKQVLVLVPEIGLTPQLVDRFKRRLKENIAVLHSGLNSTERLNQWLEAKQGYARVVLGTRSAVFTPLKDLGLVIVDEEHDLSYKQQDSLRYSSRDMALVLARKKNIPIMLGSATPSFETLLNVAQGKCTNLDLSKRAGIARPPKLTLVDLKKQRLVEHLSEVLLQRIGKTLEQQQQALLFVNRRGFAPTLICHQCAWVAACQRCEQPMTVHKQSAKLRCHHCAAETKLPTDCIQCHSPELRTLGFGTQKIEDFLRVRFPTTEVIRIDRDSTRRKGSLQSLIDNIQHGKNQILLGTQMLAKGHDFPNVSLVGILDADQGLYGSDLRSGERMAQLIIQVAGRAGRAEIPGEVIIQTYHPEHSVLTTLVNQNYGAYAKIGLAERKASGFPPFLRSVLFRAEAVDQQQAFDFLSSLKSYEGLRNTPLVECLGPVAPTMEKKAGKFRSQLLLLANDRPELHRLVNELIAYINVLKIRQKVRWSVDVDPMDFT